LEHCTITFPAWKAMLHPCDRVTGASDRQQEE
jgi:hypothetical protein